MKQVANKAKFIFNWLTRPYIPKERNLRNHICEYLFKRHLDDELEETRKKLELAYCKVLCQ
jgi:hypothetical protein